MGNIKEKINIGLDIGITSVGYSIIKENCEILDLGVRLFDDLTTNNNKLENQTRRSRRLARRRLARIKARKEDFKKILFSYDDYFKTEDEFKKFISNIDITKFDVENPIELRVKALKNKIPKEQVIFLLYHYLHHRGFMTLMENDQDDTIDNDIDNDIDNIINSESESDIGSKYHSEKILDFYKENNYYKNSDVTRSIYYKKYLVEIQDIFKINNYFSVDFQKKYIELFERLRKFTDGPGNFKNASKYGLYIKDKNGNIIKQEGNLWDKTIGKCTYYPDKLRGAKNSPITEVFNLLNDLSNIFFFKQSNLKLDKKTKEEILNLYNNSFNEKKEFNLTPKRLIKLNPLPEHILEPSNIDGYRVNKNDEKIITELKFYRLIYKFMVKYGKVLPNSNIWDINVLKEANNIFELLRSPDIMKRISNIREYFSDVELDENDLKDFIKKTKIGTSKTHSLSYDAMNDYIEYCLNNLDKNINQMVYFHENKEKYSIKNNNSNNKYINTSIFDDKIQSPVTKRAFKQSLKIINKILKIYSDKYIIDNITIEVARDKNTSAEKKRIKENQKYNENFIKNLRNEGYEIPPNKCNSSTIEKLKLWKEQNYIDIYDGQKINFDDVLRTDVLEVDHIIPYSYSSDNSFNNKVLTKKYHNSNKGNKTPKYYLIDNFEKFKQRVNDIYKKYDKNVKVNNLLYEGDPVENYDFFIGRNLSDTRYASKLVLNTLDDFFNNNNYYSDNGHKIKIKTIKGQITNFARYNLFLNSNKKTLLPKDRDLYVHHAIDAAIVNFLGFKHNINKMLLISNNFIKNCELSSNYKVDKENKQIISINTGEVFDFPNLTSPNEEAIKFGHELAKYNSIKYKSNSDENNKDLSEIINNEKSHLVKYSRMIVNKKNIQFFNESIYSCTESKIEKDIINVIKSFNICEKNISSQDGNKNGENDNKIKKILDKLLLKESNPKLYNKLIEIYNSYYTNNKINPFYAYWKDINNISDDKKIPNFINIELDDGSSWRLKKLKYVYCQKNKENCFFLKNHGNKAFTEGFNALKWRIYKNNNGKFVLLPIDINVLKSIPNGELIIDQDKLDNKMSKLNIENSAKYIELVRGTILKKYNNELYYVSGGVGANHSIEIKPISYNDKNRIRLSLSRIIKDYHIAEVDELGNLYNIREIVL